MSLFKGTSRVASGGVDQTLNTEDLTNHTVTFVDDGDCSGYSDADEITDSISTGSQIGTLFSLIKKGLKFVSDKFSEYLPLTGGTMTGTFDITRTINNVEVKQRSYPNNYLLGDTYVASQELFRDGQTAAQLHFNENGITLRDTQAATNYQIYGEHNLSLLNSRYAALHGGTQILENANLNNYTTIGNYYCQSNTTAATLTNCPITKAFRLEVRCGIGGGTSYPQQWLFAYDDGRMYTRTYNNYGTSPSWNNWKSYYPREDERNGTLLGQASNGREITSKPWFKVGWSSLSATNEDTYVVLLVNESWSNMNCGILVVKLRSGSSTASNSGFCKWLVRSSGLTVGNFVAAYNSDTSNAKIELWYKNSTSWDGYNFTVLSQGSRTARFGNPWTFASSGLTVGGSASITSGYTQVVSSDF